MTNPNKALQIAAQELRVRLVGEIKYGWTQKSLGSTVISADGALGWLRVQFRERDTQPNLLWSGNQESEHIGGILKPAVIRGIEWHYNDYIWRADLMTHISQKPCSRTPELRTDISLGREWLNELRMSLERLGRYNTPRTAVSQEAITHAIHQRFGDHIYTHISEWATIHGDMHWANITYPECWVLDWECWGTGPKALDASFLFCYSLLNKKIAERIYQRFADWLNTQDGYIAQLFACSEIMTMAESDGSHPDLYPFVVERARSLLQEEI